MKNSIRKIAAAVGILFILISFGLQKAEARPGISLQVFYDELAYYGDWINNPEYGYVWRPNVGSDFRPYYSNGRWVMTEYGNTWVSDYEWGWAPFHYGRWFYDSYDGWIWVPDTEWGPAWVTWRTGGGYYGWAPLGPRISVSINIGRPYYVPDNYWVFIPQRCIYYPSYHKYWQPRRNVYIIHNTTIINNVYTNDRRVRYYSGPGRDDVRRATRSEVPVYRIADNSRPGTTRVSRGEVNVYRPSVDRGGNDAPRAIASNNTARPSRATGTDLRRDESPRSNTSTSRPDSRANSSVSESRNSEERNRPEIDRSNTNSRPERTATPRNDYPTRTESSRSNSPAPSRNEGTSSRPQRTERSSSPRVQSGPSPSRSAGTPSGSSSSSRSSSSSSRGGSGRPSR
ncbi:DUF6600 domain-containing protein [Pelobium manganitolerans]|uniref:DUF6600 domain-containing protein n=1 Tax=Pelobium manganitolerans TaxID=1842495 RepID=UPI003FA38F6F